MKNKYDIRINPPTPESEEIRKQMDFDQLLERYREWEVQHDPAPRRSRRILWSSLAAAALLAGWVIYAFWIGRTSFQLRQEAYFAAMEYVHPPMPELDLPFSSYKLDVEEGSVYTAGSGTRLNIPPQAFETPEGQIAEGEVLIRFREMTDYADFFLAGIPMMYDSAGTEYHLESAGMIEVYAEQNGRRLQLRDDKAISIELPAKVRTTSLEAPADFNLYKLDTKNRRWVFRGKNQMEIKKEALQVFDSKHPLYAQQQSFKEQITALQRFREEEIRQLESLYPLPPKPLKPLQPDENELVFDLNFKLPNQEEPAFAKHPELQKLQQTYGEVLWQLSPGQDASAEELAQNWQDASLDKVNERDYLLTLSGNETRLELLITPVVPQTDYAAAMQRYREKMAAYEAALQEREKRIARQKAELLDKYRLEEQKLANTFEKAIRQLAKNQPEALKEIHPTPVLNRFAINELGIWNCDRPVAPKMVEIKANFVLPDGTPVENQTLYLADKSRNTLQRFLAANDTRLTIDLFSENILWALTPDGQIAKLPKEELLRLRQAVAESEKTGKKPKKLPGSYTFVLRPTGLKTESKEDVKMALEG